MFVKHYGVLVATIGSLMSFDEVTAFLKSNEIDIPASELELEYSHSETLELRQKAYKDESDPLHMEWQHDQTELSKQAWLSKVEEIKARYPFPA